MDPTIDEMIGEFDAGIFTSKVTALKLVTIGTIENDKKGQVTIILDFEQIGDSSSVQVKHTLKYNILYITKYLSATLIINNLIRK
jgi:hypothetical protein